MAISIPSNTQTHRLRAWVQLEPMCLNHIGGKSIISLNRTGHICAYIFLTSPVYPQSIPITYFPYKGFSRSPAIRGLKFQYSTHIISLMQDLNPQLPVPPQMGITGQSPCFYTVSTFRLNLTHLLCLCQTIHPYIGNFRFFLHHVNAQYRNYLILYKEVQIHEVQFFLFNELDILQ